jgi:short-subunit dehydrogenase
MSTTTARPFAIVTGGSSGIGLELAKQFLHNGFDVLIAADTRIEEATEELRAIAGEDRVASVWVDLSTFDGVKELHEEVTKRNRKVDVLAANAGVGLGGSFFDQEREAWLKVVQTNIIGTLDLIHLVGRDLRAGRQGRILITSSIASQIPGSFNAVYNATKAFLQSFSFAIRNELKDTGVTVTALLPGVTDTDFFERAGMEDTKIGQEDKDDPAAVAKIGFKALMDGEGDVVFGMKNKIRRVAAKFTSDDSLAETHRRMSEPGTAPKAS